jgi:hypothetical protein
MKQTLPTLKVALLGCGVVGSEVARLLTEQADDLALRVGARLELAGIGVRRVGHRRAAGIDLSLLTADAHALATRPDVDIVVEVIGGIEPARSLLLAGGYREQGPARRERRGDLRGGPRVRRRPVLRGLGGRRHPAAAPAA